MPGVSRRGKPKRPVKAAPARARGEAPERLRAYRARRHFDRTPEPSGSAAVPSTLEGPRFVVQQHAARRLHYDFRLELDGVLLSWSVPKGPSLSPGVRRLAVRTEDHPVAYVDFEGVIPQGEYGAGAVLVWDCGTWSAEGDARESMQKGRLTFTLHGQKLRGRFHLVRTRLSDDKHENWLLFKGRDAEARETEEVVEERPESALTGRTLEQVRTAPERVWHSDRASAARERGAAKARSRAARTKEPAPAARTPEEASQELVGLLRQLSLGFSLTHLEKVLYPEQGIRKAELIAYYAAISSYLLPQLAGRPLTLVRCPDGRHKKCFFQKHLTRGAPSVIKPIDVSEQRSHKTETYMLVNDLPGLIALGQVGALELHTWGCHADKLERPDQLVFDLDPDEGLDFERVIEAALTMRAYLEELGLLSFVKTTGGKGLHVVAPLQRRLNWDEHKELSRHMAEEVVRRHPQRYLLNMRKALRKDKVFIDYLRNGRGATAVAPYSPRARAGAPVATPLRWQELEAGARPSDFNLSTVVARIAKQPEDPWHEYARVKQSVSAATMRKLGMRT